jgi:hypothetical protein
MSNPWLMIMGAIASLSMVLNCVKWMLEQPGWNFERILWAVCAPAWLWVAWDFLQLAVAQW